jgi:hypothetical protein
MNETTPDTTTLSLYRSGALSLLEEIFAKTHGMILDRDTSLFDTLAGIDAETASLKYSPYCSNLAAQVNHTRFYLDVLIRSMRDKDETPADWDSSWEVDAVTPEEWAKLVEDLRSSYETTRETIATLPAWNADAISGGMAIIAHSAYHLGEIRQALAIIPVVKADAVP